MPLFLHARLMLCLLGAVAVVGRSVGMDVQIIRPADLLGVQDPLVQRLGAPQLSPAGDKPVHVVFDGKGDGLVVKRNPLQGLASFTVEVLFLAQAGGGEAQRFVHFQDTQGRRLLIELRLGGDQQWSLDTHLYESAAEKHTLLDLTRRHPLARWHWVALTYGEGRMRHYVDGVLEGESPLAFGAMEGGEYSLGVRLTQRSWLKGGIAELRISPAVLAPEQLQRTGYRVKPPAESH